MKYLQLIIFLILVISIVGVGHASVYYALKSTLLFTTKYDQLLLWLMVGLSLSFIIMSIIVRAFYHPIISTLYTISAVWLGTVYRLFMASVVIIILSIINSYSSRTIPITQISYALLISAICISGYGIRNSNQTRITHYTVPIANLPTERQGKKIAMISDTHVGAIKNIGLITKIKPLIEGAGASILLVAGDFYDGVQANDTSLAQALGTITTTYGTYFAPGNHEEYNNLNHYLDDLKHAGIHVLNNETSVVNGLHIIGVDYQTSNTSTGLTQLLSQLAPQSGQPSILIKHVPNHPEIIAQFGIDLQVAGHVHQGQVRPGPRIARKVFGLFAYGLNRIGQSWIITSSGVGTWGPPQRIGTHSEIVIITLQDA